MTNDSQPAETSGPGAPGSSGGWKARAAKLALLSVSLLMTLVAFEVGLRLTAARPRTVTVLSSYFQPSATVGWIGSPGAASQFVSTDFDVFVSHDADGLRRCGLDSSIAADAGEAGEVTWFLGDSGTWGWGVDDGKTYVDHLNRLGGGQAKYRNLGICGASSVQQLLVLEQRLKRQQKPDRVVVLFCSNDLWENIDTEHQDPPRPYYEVKQGQAQLRNYPVPQRSGYQARTWLKKNSLAYNHLHFYASMARKRLKEYRRSGAAVSPETATLQVAEPAAAKASPDQIVALEAAYGQMKQLCELYGVELAVATEIAAWKQVIEPVCRRQSIPLLDLSTRWDAHAAAGGERTDFPSDPHYNETGHRLLAEALDEELKGLQVAARRQGEKAR